MDYKTCFTCGKSLPATPEYYHKDSQKSDGFRPECKECRSQKRRERYAIDEELQIKVRKRAAEWAKENPEQHKANKRRNYLENREARIEYTRQWRLENPEKYREHNRNKWQRLSIEQKRQVTANVRNRRARIKGNGGTHTAEDIQEILEGQGYMCFYCKYPLDDYEVDHYYPIAKGGSNAPDNLVVACVSCNRSKGDKLPEEFYALAYC